MQPICQKTRTAPNRYRVTVEAKNTRFNVKVYINLTYIEEASVLHMVGNTTHFSAGKPADPLTTDIVGETMLI